MKTSEPNNQNVKTEGKSLSLAISFSLLFVFSISAISLNFWNASKSSEDAIAINLSGKQRMLIQRMAKDLLQLKFLKQNYPDVSHIQQDLLNSYRLFNQTLAMLDKSIFTDKNGREFSVNSTQTKKISDLVKLSKTLWKPIDTSLGPLISNEANFSSNYLEQSWFLVLRDNENLMQLMDSITGEIEKSAHNYSDNLRMTEASAIALLLINFGFVVYYFKRQLDLISENKLLSMLIIEKVGTAIVVTNEKGNIELCNHAAENMFGYNTGTLSGNNIQDLMEPPYFKQIGKRLNGEKFTLDIELNQINVSGHKLFITSLYDKTEQKLEEARLIHLAYHDPLTELPNRILFMDRLAQTIARAHRNNELVAVLFIDLDKFKPVNDTLGHGIGDLLLQNVASRLKACLREGDTLARLGGDEFTMLIDASDVDICVIVTQRILSVLNEAFIIEGHSINISGSIGASLYPNNGNDISLLLHYADIAMYQAKAMGGNTCCKYPVTAT
jgi:diguanylate cyclase (GGDEF)-like protein